MNVDYLWVDINVVKLLLLSENIRCLTFKYGSAKWTQACHMSHILMADCYSEVVHVCLAKSADAHQISLSGCCFLIPAAFQHVTQYERKCPLPACAASQRKRTPVYCWGAYLPVGVIISFAYRNSVVLPPTASFFFFFLTCSRSADVSCILIRNRPPVFYFFYFSNVCLGNDHIVELWTQRSRL